MQARGTEVAAELLARLPDPVIGCDAGGAVVWWNQAAETAYGYTASEALGQRAASLLRTRFPAPLLEITEELADLGSWQGRLEHRCKDGRTVAVESRRVAWRDGNGETIGSVAIERGLQAPAASRLSPESAGSAAAETPEVDGLQPGDPTARALAHELNNALAIIINYTAFVTAELETQTGGATDATRADLGEIQAAAERALQATRRLAGEL